MKQRSGDEVVSSFDWCCTQMICVCPLLDAPMPNLFNIQYVIEEVNTHTHTHNIKHLSKVLHLWLSRKYLAAYNTIWAWSFGVFMCVLNTCKRQTEWKGNVCGVCVHVWPSLNREKEATKDEVVCHFYIRWHLDLCLNFLSVLVSVKSSHTKTGI